jgi:tyrosinase
MTVHLGPSNFSTALEPAVGSGTGLDFNPRCLRRDISSLFGREALSYGNITNLLTRSANYHDFATTLQIGVHGAGHLTAGGMMGDLFSSPADPVFYLHHAQVDRMWSIWQSLRPERQNQLQGPTTWFNSKWGTMRTGGREVRDQG